MFSSQFLAKKRLTQFSNLHSANTVTMSPYNQGHHLPNHKNGFNEFNFSLKYGKMLGISEAQFARDFYACYKHEGMSAIFTTYSSLGLFHSTAQGR